jgi:hypothetical protein
VQKKATYEIVYPCGSGEIRVPACVVFEYSISSKGKPKRINHINKGIENRFMYEARRALRKTRWEASAKNESKTPVRDKAIYRFNIAGMPEASCE